jgi:hypothetical protein
MIPAAMQYQKNFAYNSISFYVIGFIFFAISKWSIIKTGKYFTFGSFQMSKGNRIIYRIGYLLMGLGFLSTFSLFIILK